MADLHSRYDNPQTGERSVWRYTLPEGQDISIGRRPLTDHDVPDWNRSDWVVKDERVSGRHVILTFDGKELRVRRRLEPTDRPAINPVFYKGVQNDEFKLMPGESFTIGTTTFTLQLREAAPEETNSTGLTHTISRKDLRMGGFVNAQRPLMALAELPSILRQAQDDSALEESVLDVILNGLPIADFACFVQIDPLAGPDARAAITRYKHRNQKDDNVNVSHRLVRHTTRDVFKSVIYIWDKKLSESKLSMTYTPGTDWAICTPLEEQSTLNRAIYVAGQTTKNILTADQLKTDVDFHDHQKFVNLVAEFFASMREMRKAEDQNSRLRRYLPRRIVAMMQNSDLDKELDPKVAEVTALFCDLRGASKYAEENKDLLQSWKRMSLALDDMVTPIHEHGGVIGGLQGDAAVGFWGWPSSAVEQIDSAVRAALSIRRIFARNLELEKSKFNCGIGLAHGEGVVGRLGTYDSFKLDAYGDTMNLASRLESMTKHFGVKILVDEAIRNRHVKVDPTGLKARVRSMGKVKPAGMNKRLAIFELMPALVDSDPEEAGIRYALWETGIAAFIRGEFANARELIERFTASLSRTRKAFELNEGGPAHVFLDFMAKHKDPPETSEKKPWDGTIEMNAK